MERELEFIRWFNDNKKNIDEIDRIEILGEISPLHKKLKKAYYKKFMDLKYKKNTYLYLTLSPDKFLRNIDPTKENLQAIQRWCEKWFTRNPKYYGKDYCWVVEVGSDGQHPHIHCLVELKTSHKHAQNLKKAWARAFPKSQLLTTKNLSSSKDARGEYTYLRIDDPKIIQDKLEYFENDKKGLLHENLYDTGLRGSGGIFSLT
jgi:hypothetical protein